MGTGYDRASTAFGASLLGGVAPISGVRCTLRIAALIAGNLLLSTEATRSAPMCRYETIALASHRRQILALQNNAVHSPKAHCRAYLERFIEAVGAHKAAASCEAGVERQQAFVIIEADLQAFNDRIAEGSCMQ